MPPIRKRWKLVYCTTLRVICPSRRTPASNHSLARMLSPTTKAVGDLIGGEVCLTSGGGASDRGDALEQAGRGQERELHGAYLDLSAGFQGVRGLRRQLLAVHLRPV